MSHVFIQFPGKRNVFLSIEIEYIIPRAHKHVVKQVYLTQALQARKILSILKCFTKMRAILFKYVLALPNSC